MVERARECLGECRHLCLFVLYATLSHCLSMQLNLNVPLWEIRALLCTSSQLWRLSTLVRKDIFSFFTNSALLHVIFLSLSGNLDNAPTATRKAGQGI